MKKLNLSTSAIALVISLSLSACATSGQEKYSYSEIVALEEFAVTDAARRPVPVSRPPEQAITVTRQPSARGAMLSLSQNCGVHAEASDSSPKHSTMPMGKKLWVTPIADKPDWIVVQRASGPAFMSRACF